MTYTDIEMYEDTAAREEEVLEALLIDLYICETQGCNDDGGICERCGTVLRYEAEDRDAAEYNEDYPF